jgi:hypothetical protein
MTSIRLLVLGLVLALAGCDRVERPLTNATRFVARMSCSCVFVMKRELADCLGDLPKEASWLDVAADSSAGTVTANALWVDGVARYTEGRGCRLRD